MKTIEEAAKEYASCEIEEGSLSGLRGIDASKLEPFKAGIEFVQQWIDVEDELPPENIPVIVKMNYCFAFTDITATDICYLKNNRWINALRNQHSSGSVMAWRPIEYK